MQPEVDQRVHKILPLEPILSQINLILAFTHISLRSMLISRLHDQYLKLPGNFTNYFSNICLVII